MGRIVNKQKSTVFLYTNNVQLETKVTKAIPFLIASKISKEKEKLTYIPKSACTGPICQKPKC